MHSSVFNEKNYLISYIPPTLSWAILMNIIPLWCSKTINDKGKQLEDFIFQENLCIFIDGTDTYLHPGNGSYSAIDLTVSDPSVLLDCSWKVHDDLCGSDHFSIILESLNSTVGEIGLLLTRKLLNQGFLLVNLKSSLRKFCGRHHDLVDLYGISVSQMTTNMFHLSQTLPGPFLVHDLSSGL